MLVNLDRERTAHQVTIELPITHNTRRHVASIGYTLTPRFVILTVKVHRTTFHDPSVQLNRLHSCRNPQHMQHLNLLMTFPLLLHLHLQNHQLNPAVMELPSPALRSLHLQAR